MKILWGNTRPVELALRTGFAVWFKQPQLKLLGFGKGNGVLICKAGVTI